MAIPPIMSMRAPLLIIFVFDRLPLMLPKINSEMSVSIIESGKAVVIVVTRYGVSGIKPAIA